MSEPLIVAENVSKAFSLRDKLSRSALARELWSAFWGRPQRPKLAGPSSFLALDDVSFTVARGEVLGVIGHNGAGKTTLLRLLSGEYVPDRGRIEVKGTRSNLVDLTAGFSPNMTGRENIYFRGAHLGFSREFLREREQAIIDFAGIGEFIDSEIKSYSSGMLLRLGFAVNVFVEPDVLLIDEVLAVGDFLFAAKCMRKMNEIKRNTAIVYVTHNLQQIVNFTNKTMVLDRGKAVFLGAPAEAVDYYQALELTKDNLGTSRLSRMGAEKTKGAISKNLAGAPHHDLILDDGALTKESLNEDIEEEENGANFPALAAENGRFINNEAVLADLRCSWVRSDGTVADSFEGNEPLHLKVSFRALETICHFDIGVVLWSERGVHVTSFATHSRPIERLIQGGARHVITLVVPEISLNKGRYYSVLSIIDGGEHIYRQPGPILQILSNRDRFGWGLISLEYQWHQDSLPTHAKKWE